MPAPSRQLAWRRAHLGTDRKLLRCLLPIGLVEDAEAHARALGLSLAALTALGLTLALRQEDDLATLLRIVERTHHMRFRRGAPPTRSAPGISAPSAAAKR